MHFEETLKIRTFSFSQEATINALSRTGVITANKFGEKKEKLKILRA